MIKRKHFDSYAVLTYANTKPELRISRDVTYSVGVPERAVPSRSLCLT